jgi:starvation-inducible DNA-binding protein
VFGPLSRPVHLLLVGLVDSWRGLADTVAERALALGFVLDGQAQAVAARSQLNPIAQEESA